MIVLNSVLRIHEVEAAFLSELRMAQLNSPHVNLQALARLDNRLAAHVDGLKVTREHTRSLVYGELDEGSTGAVFTAAVRAIEDKQLDRLDELWSLAKGNPRVRDGVIASLEWVESRHLQGIVRDLLTSGEPQRRAVGLAACAIHQADPGLRSGPWLWDPECSVRASAFRALGELGLSELVTTCIEEITRSEDAGSKFWTVWSAVLLGNRGAALDALRLTAVDASSPHTDRAFRLTLQALDTASAHTLLGHLARNGKQPARLLHGSGIVGDPAYVPWLIGYMQKPETARLAGESFTLITGAELDNLQLYGPQPAGFEGGPNEETDDDNVAMDPDDGLMWPDSVKAERWWRDNANRFQPGTRYFMGKPVTREHCIDVLKKGYQRQRILAAHYLCLLEPGTPLFNTSAPAWRQQRLLAAM
jgi:uncharacterized protein (TIGR02270 family)